MSGSMISELESIQKSLGKAILCLPVTTAKDVVYIELGWKPFGIYIVKSKLGYFKRVSDPFFQGKPRGKVLHGLERFLTVKAVNEHHEAMISAQVQLLPSLRLLPIPKKWWRPAPNLFVARWRTVLTRFRAMNVGLGHGDAYRADDAVTDSGGRVKICPLCLAGDNNKVHLLIQCKCLSICRAKILVHGGVSLDRVLTDLCYSPLQMVLSSLGTSWDNPLTPAKSSWNRVLL